MAKKILTCLYCSYEYPMGTPASESAVLTEHIMVCEKHPMKKIVDDNTLLRKALVGIIGKDEKESLEQMEMVILYSFAPEIDKINTINAIQALLQTQGPV